jgi:phosphatidylglycerophosphate synthase
VAINKKSFLLVNSITLLRVFLSVWLFFLILQNSFFYAFIVYLFISFSDFLDGFMAKKLNVMTTFGSFFDTFVDFLFVFLSFLAFYLIGIYPLTLLFITSFMFIQYIVTFIFFKQKYDPVGRYYAIYLFAFVGISIVFPELIRGRLLIMHMSIAGIAFVSRTFFLITSRKRD